MTDAPMVIRPQPQGQTPVSIIRRAIVPGQVWAVDGEGVQWFVLTPERVIALFPGGEDHTPSTLFHTYGDRLRLASDATVYRSHDWPEQWKLATVSTSRGTIGVHGGQ